MTTPKTYEALAEMGAVGFVLFVIILPFWLAYRLMKLVLRWDYRS